MIPLLLIAAVVLFIISKLASAEPKIEEPQVPEIMVPEPEITPLPEITPGPINKEFDPKKYFKSPGLWKYEINKDYDVIIAKNYQDYIMPDNEIVKYFANNIYLYSEDIPTWAAPNSLIPRFIWNKGKLEGEDKPTLSFKYEEDSDKLFNIAGQPPDYDSSGVRDFWINPDYYIYNGFVGDCEDYALLWASVFEIWKIPYVVVGGWQTDKTGKTIRDWWVEFEYNDKIYRAQVVQKMYIRDTDPYKYQGKLMFSKNMKIRSYYSNWHL